MNFAATTAPAAGAFDITFGGNTYGVAVAAWDNTGTAAAAESNYQALKSSLDTQLSNTGLSATVDEFGNVAISGPSGAVAGDITVGAGFVGNAFSNTGSVPRRRWAPSTPRSRRCRTSVPTSVRCRTGSSTPSTT